MDELFADWAERTEQVWNLLQFAAYSSELDSQDMVVNRAQLFSAVSAIPWVASDALKLIAGEQRVHIDAYTRGVKWLYPVFKKIDAAAFRLTCEPDGVSVTDLFAAMRYIAFACDVLWMTDDPSEPECHTKKFYRKVIKMENDAEDEVDDFARRAQSPVCVVKDSGTRVQDEIIAAAMLKSESEVTKNLLAKLAEGADVDTAREFALAMTAMNMRMRGDVL